MKNTTVAIVAIAAVAALLVASTTISTLTNQAFAGGHKRSGSTHQTATQSCLNNANSNDENEANVSCQNDLSQINGNDNAGTVTGNQAPLQK